VELFFSREAAPCYKVDRLLVASRGRDFSVRLASLGETHVTSGDSRSHFYDALVTRIQFGSLLPASHVLHNGNPQMKSLR